MKPRVFDAEVCVVIVNYRTPAMVIDCLETILPQARAIGAAVALVDNASPDDSVGKLQGWIRENAAQDCVSLIQSTENGGFAAGNNIGIESCNARAYLLLNSDTLLREGALQRLLEELSQNPNAGIVSPRLEWPNGEPQESCFRYHRPISELVGSAGTGPVTKLLARYEVAIPVSDERSLPEWTSFACVMIRGEVIEQTGLLDAGFFMYFEDVDLSYRVREAGWEILHEPAARVVHLRGGSSPVKSRAKLRKRLPRYFYESRSRYFYKIYGHAGLLAANLCWTAGWMISSARSVVQPRYLAPNCESQWRDIWTNFWKPMAPYTHPQGSKR